MLLELEAAERERAGCEGRGHMLKGSITTVVIGLAACGLITACSSSEAPPGEAVNRVQEAESATCQLATVSGSDVDCNIECNLQNHDRNDCVGTGKPYCGRHAYDGSQQLGCQAWLCWCAPIPSEDD